MAEYIKIKKNYIQNLFTNKLGILFLLFFIANNGFAQNSTGSIGNFVYRDFNHNGIQDLGEFGIEGIILELYAADNVGLPIGNAIKKDTTDNNGNYLFSSLSAGNYVVKLLASSIATGSQITQQDLGENDTLDSDFNLITGLSDKITIDLNSQIDVLTIDAGIFNPFGSIGNLIWIDTNNNGIYDATERGAKGIVLELYAADAEMGHTIGNVLATDTTNDAGIYNFSNLMLGAYMLKILPNSLPTNYVISLTNTANKFNAQTGYSGVININTTDVATKDNQTINGAIYTSVNCLSLTLSATQTEVCAGTSTDLKGNLNGTGRIKWYTVATGGTAINTTDNDAVYTVSPTTTTTYYAEIENPTAGCENPRKAIIVTVNPKPNAPITSGTVQVCENTTINLNNYIVGGVSTSGGTFEWHNMIEDATSPIISPTMIAKAGSYFVFEKSAAGCSSNASNELKISTTTCNKQIDLSLEKTVDNITPVLGSNLTYSINISNAGPDIATNVEITDELPAGLQFISSPAFSSSNGVLTATIPQVDVGKTIYLTYIAKLTGTTAQVNFAQITKATEKDLDSTPNNGRLIQEDDNAQLTIIAQNSVGNADISLEKSVNNETPSQNETIIYTIQVKNNGPSTATNVEVNDVVPTGLKVTNANGADAVTITNNDVIAKFNQIAVGETKTIQISAIILAESGLIRNWAQVTKSDQQDPNSLPNNGIDKEENDDDYADITIRQTGICNPTTPLISTNNPYICSGETIVLEAIGCTNGTTVWSDGQTGSKINITPTSNTTYTAQCKINDSCISPKSDALQIVTNVITAPIISTLSLTTVCSGGSVTLSATNCTGTVNWSTGQVGTSIVVMPTVTTTYSATCKRSNCISGVSNPITITVSAGTSGQAPFITTSNPKICVGGNTTLTATGCTGTTLWSNAQSGTTITVSPQQTTTYTASCKIGDCASIASNEVTITVSAKDIPIISATKENLCGSETITLTVTGCSNKILWSAGGTTTSITVTPTVTTTYEVACINEPCIQNASKTITIGETTPVQPTITQDLSIICSGESKTLTANNCSGIVTWNTGATGNTLIVTPIATTIYTATCTINGCVSQPASITVNVSTITPITLSANPTSICSGGILTLTVSNCNGEIKWFNGTNSPSIILNPIASNTYSVTCTTNCGTSSASLLVPVTTGQAPAAPTITTSTNNICGNAVATISASACEGSIKWSTGATGTSIMVGAAGTYSAICSTSCGESVKSNEIVITTNTILPPIVLGTNTAICEPQQITLTANNCAGTIVWSNGQSGTSITVNVAATTTFSAICRNNGCESTKSNEITVSVGKLDKPTISSDKQSICGNGSVILTATGCDKTVVWSNGQTGTTITVNPTNTTDFTALCKLNQSNCTSDYSNKITISVIDTLSVPQIKSSVSTLCKGDTATLTSTGCASTIVWSNGQSGATIKVSPAATSIYTAICKSDLCESGPSNPATISVGYPTTPILSATNTQVCKGSSIQITATGCMNEVKWSDGQTGAVITVSPTATTTYSATCSSGTCQSDKSNQITIQVNENTGSITKPTTTNVSNVCPAVTVDLSKGVTSKVTTEGGKFVYHVSNTTASQELENTQSIGGGTYFVFEQSSNGCYSTGAAINVLISTCGSDSLSCKTNPATAIAGKDTTVCLSPNYFNLKGKVGGSATNGSWTSTGTGKFENASALNTKYTYSETDIATGNVTFTLTSNDPDGIGSCVAASSSFKVTFNKNAKATQITASKLPNICYGDSVTLSAVEAGNYKWNTSAIGRSIVVKKAGTYYATLVNTEGCASLNSNEIVVTVSDTIPAPNVTNIMKNICPAKTVNLNNAILSKPYTTNGIFEFHTENSTNSPSLVEVMAKGTGNYYAVERNTLGCYGQISPIFVRIDDCPPIDSSKIDVAVELIGSASEITVGNPITFTLKVTNNSSKPATNIKVANYIPAGLILTGSPASFTGKDTLTTTIASLAAKETKTYTYTAKTAISRKILNIAEITKLDQADYKLSNNISIWEYNAATVEMLPIGVALMADTVRQTNGSYNIIYKATIKNFGSVTLRNVQICDTLSNTFTDPAVATIVQKPKVNANSLLKVDSTFNGKVSNSCMLLPTSEITAGSTDTLIWVVNLQLNENKGPFQNNIIVTSNTSSDQLVSDISNDGINPNAAGNLPTVVNFTPLPDALIGIAKSVSEPVAVEGKANTYDMTFTFVVKNYSKKALTQIQVRDDLSATFGDSVKIDSVKIMTTDESLKINPNYTGRGSLINLLVDSLSTLPLNTSSTITLFTRITNSSGKSTFENLAIAKGQYDINTVVDDISTTGSNPDPDANGTPRNNSLPTIIKLGNTNTNFNTTLGIAKQAILDSVKNADGTYNLAYKVIIKNYGTNTLTGVQLVDSLDKVFADSTIYILRGTPSLNTSSKLKLNKTLLVPEVTTILIADSSSLAVGATDTLSFNLRLLSKKSGNVTFSNSILGTAKDGTTDVYEVSQTGINPDPDGDKNPGNNNEPTLFTIKGQTAITDTTNSGKIPEGFSPNGDGVNDLFSIKGINSNDDVESEIYIYNRWGGLVYHNADFGKVEGWNAVANSGVLIGNKNIGVPDGTYYYWVKANGYWSNKPVIGFITLVR